MSAVHRRLCQIVSAGKFRLSRSQWFYLRSRHVPLSQPGFFQSPTILPGVFRCQKILQKCHIRSFNEVVDVRPTTFVGSHSISYSMPVGHKLFHEAQRRASQAQPLVKYKAPKSLLLPAPNNIIFELFNTVVKEVAAEKLMDFVTSNLKGYLYASWANKITQQAIQRLKREQTIDVRAGLVNAPVIKFSTGVHTARPATTVVDTIKTKQQQQQTVYPTAPAAIVQATKSPQNVTQTDSPPSSPPFSPPQNQASDVGHKQQEQHQQQQQQSPGSPKSPHGSSRTSMGGSGVGAQRSPPMDYKASASKQRAIDQIYEHVMWRIKTDNVTQITSILIKLVLDDGYKKATLKVETYNEIAECFEDWRGRKLVKLYAFGAAPANDQKLVLASTTAGDLTKWVANYIDGSDKRQKPDLIRVLATALRDKKKNCIYITNELVDALKSLETGALRCVFLVDRLSHYDPVQSMPKFSTDIEPLITSGKLFVMSSLSCVEFAPDPSNDTCC